MNRKLLFFDIDGTLIDSFHKEFDIPASVLQRLRKIQEQGHYIFIASGRPKALLHSAIFKGNFDGYILVNGAHVEFQGKNIYQECMDYNLIKETIQILKTYECDYILETANNIYCNSNNQELIDFFSEFEDTRVFVRDFDTNQVLKETLKLETVITEAQKNQLISKIQNKLSYDQHGTDAAFELYSSSINKSVGIQKILDYLGAKKEDTYAFGDGVNDLDMCKFCGTGVAMGNAVPELKEIADIVCDSIDNDGLAKILDELFFS